MKYERMTDELIRKLNKSCEALRAAGNCADECMDIGWCPASWSGIETDNDTPEANADEAPL